MKIKHTQAKLYNHPRPCFNKFSEAAPLLQQTALRTHAYYVRYWRFTKQTYQFLCRVQQNATPLNQLHSQLYTKYTNYALYTACYTHAKAGRHQRRFNITLKMFINGGSARANRLMKFIHPRVLLPTAQQQLLFLYLTQSKDNNQNFLNETLQSRTVVNPLYPPRLPPTRLRLDRCFLNFIAPLPS